jgi:UDP-GlcNAc:undecaprenyl-phosphate GlcNAc-1-phosphate transferase
MTWKTDLLAFGAALLASTLLTPLIRWVIIKLGFFDRPDYRKVHSKLIPSMGGIAIYLAFMISGFLFLPSNKFLSVFFLCSFLLIILGLIDDIFVLSAWTKFSGQLIVALLTVIWGIKVDFMSVPEFVSSKNLVYLAKLSVPLTVFWILSVINSINLIDGLDGLAGGVSIIVALTLAVVGYLREPTMANPDKIHYVIQLAVILIGSVLGFLWYNFHPASIFMGDTGSMFLGYTLAVISILGAMKGATLIALLVPLLALGLPLFDSVLAVVRRKLDNKSIFAPDKEHFHHQLLDIGLTHRQVVLLFYLISICLGGWAIYISSIKLNSAIFVVIFLAFLFFLGAWRIRKIKKKFKD